MILTTLLFAGAAIVGTTLIAKYWNNIVDWLKRAVNKVGEIVKGIVYGTKVLIKKIYEGIKEISKHYSQDELGRWEETTITRTVPENEVPEEIRRKASMNNVEVDITNDVEMQLEMA